MLIRGAFQVQKRISKYYYKLAKGLWNELVRMTYFETIASPVQR